MAEELGKIEKPNVEDFKKGRKLYFVPLLFSGKELPKDFEEKLNKYWEQVEAQIASLELKLGMVSRVYHELIATSGEEGLTILKELNVKSYEIARCRVEKGAKLEATEEGEVLTEFMDWGRCLAIGLQSNKVMTKVYQAYLEANQKRNETIAKRLDETLKADETGVLLMAEEHHVSFPSDVQVFYIAPPALDEIKRWLRDRESRQEPPKEKEKKEEK